MFRYSKDRLGKIILYMATDGAMITLSLAVATSLWFEGTVPGSHALGAPEGAWTLFGVLAGAAVAVCFAVSWAFRLYNNLWKYASIDEVFKIFLATVITFLLIYAFNLAVLEENREVIFTRRLFFLAWLMFFVMYTFSRFGYRAVKRVFVYVGHVMSSKAGMRRVMVVGAGFAGYGVVRGMLSQTIRDKIPVIIVDDDASKNNTNIMGVRVLSQIDRITELCEKFRIDEIIIAKNAEREEDLRGIISQCTLTDCSVKILPPISDITGDGAIGAIAGKGAANAPMLRDLNISDLLFREEVTLDVKTIRDYLAGRVVMVTGGGGSIGSELCRQITAFGPERLIIFDNYEHNAFMLKHELIRRFGDKIRVSIRIGSVQDIGRLDQVFAEFEPHVIFHAAAHKHGPLMEENPGEAVKNNVFGAQNVLEAAHRFGAQKFVLLSTDKAVNPTSVMGTTKRITEILMQDIARVSNTKFMAVRFGNVLGSMGSILPLFQEQIEAGGPLTVTHRDIERYFMTIPEAVGLVLQAASLGKTGRIFVLDMGSPVKIDDLARNFVKLSGLRVGSDIEIAYTGLRPGEKLTEELFTEEERVGMQMTFHKKIFMTKPSEHDSARLKADMERLLEAATKRPDDLHAALKQIVPNFKEADNS
ncbi:MAG: polysaccharide biosynthesis protein [Defluviitaleaceae bacterium]|nr:polysaccharide biosynthesis protein [Defluviitaleaceae bacterium]